MIFKQLFRSKHQSSDPQIRLQAIEKLDNQVPEQKSILHELAFNDADVNVSLAALNQLNSFALWYKMAETAKNERIQKKSRQYVENKLLAEHSDGLSEADKQQFIQEVRDPQLLEKLLAQPWVQQNTELALKLVNKLDKPLVLERVLFDSANEQLQSRLLSSFNDSSTSRKLLAKIQRKPLPDTLKKAANQMLDEWLAAEKEPVELEQQVTMVLSRLLALKDQGNLEQVQQQQIMLSNQYADLSQRFDCLPAVKREEIEQKYAQITQRVERNIALLEPDWQAQQDTIRLNQATTDLAAAISLTQQQLNSQLDTRISDMQPSDSDEFVATIEQQQNDLHKLTSQIPSSEHHQHRQLEQLNNQLISSLSTLKNLPDFQLALQKMQGVMDKFTSLALPTDISQVEAAQDYIREQKSIWHNTLGHYSTQVPANMTQQWNEMVAAWQGAIKKLKAQIRNDVARCQNKLRAVENLISQGKYKAAMGLYQKIQSWFNALPEQQQNQLGRTFNNVKEQIENLKDWQEYIAAPRKPALLSEAEALAEQPLGIDAQGEAIKALRSQWNSLGKSDTEADKALNVAFETAIEKAFAPCRKYYEQQQIERQQNLHTKQGLLKDIGVLGQQDIPTSELAKSLRNLQQKWRAVGEVDFKIRNEMYTEYQQMLAPLKEKVATFYTDNAQQKRVLVEKVSQLLELESVNEAIEQAKQLQQKWKTIEHAGAKAEKELWAKFRQANDNLFSKRAELNQLEKSNVKQKVSQTKALLSQLAENLDKATDIVAVQNALQDKQAAIDIVNTLPVNEQRKLELEMQNLLQLQQAKIMELKKLQHAQQYKTLFLTLQNWQVEDQTPEQVAMLNKTWVQCFSNIDPQIQRAEVTIKMEIVAQVDSPKKDADMRQSIQMQLMADKLQSGNSLSLAALLEQWIKAGPLDQADLTLLKRVEPLFVS